MEARQGGRVITQTLTRATTTITALVTLGGDGAVPTTFITSTTPPAAPPVTTIIAPVSTSTTLTNEQLGAILGSVLGFLVIVLPICYCCFRDRPVRRRFYRGGHSDSSSDGEEEVVVDGRGRDAWAAAAAAGIQMRQGPVLNPAPPRIPPRRYAGYRQTVYPQIAGVRRYP